MGIAANVARRGGVYWWRGRIGPGRQRSRVIAKSLRTRDPEIARTFGSQITGMVARLRQSVRLGAMTVDEAESEISAFVVQYPFAADPKLLERLDAERRGPINRVASQDLDYSAEQEVRMLADFARRMGPILERAAAEVRTRPPLVLNGIAEDWVADAIRNDRVQAEVCRLLGLSGTSARVRPDDRTELLDAGFSTAEIDDIDKQAQRHASREADPDWLIGPERDVLVFHLQAVGAIPTIENVGRLRRATLLVLANLLHAHVGRYRSVPKHYAAIIAGASEQDVTTGVEQVRPTEAWPGVSTIVPPSVPGPVSMSEAVAVAPCSASFLAIVEQLARGKTQKRSREWDDKTAGQHRSIAKLFAKLAKTDNPALMTQEHVGSYLDLLRIIPTHYGKSSADEERTIDEILARSEDLDEDEIGLAPPTINRHRGQLGTILKFMKRHGFNIGVIDEDSRARDARAPGEKRVAFTHDDGIRLMRVVDEHSQNLGHIDTDALFWVPQLAWYQMLRLSEGAGLAPDDIDLTTGLIHIRPNALRRTKTHSSVRVLPIHPELDRLGFRQFVASAQSRGSKQLFPGLFTRNSEFAAVFHKMWTPVLDAALPLARQHRKTLHSTRKTGNSAMHVPAIKDNTRLYILGHAKLEINGKHYLKPPSPAEVLEALSYVSIVTGDLAPRSYR
ncbi:hypothetical protein [Lichenifustis flavocetrariae]|uniref:Tyr recombinase domain-containing protein n=1 Tax=Lichenifustis flavocetrariae TaxID=2949735 RepID=A0AA41Z0T0_9HYPH|nr:hypothetical protein [Lichenifustis flavocetrariae]MCW6512096.1 hypothetical protein [Lichenifustis flavocetrariae]